MIGNFIFAVTRNVWSLVGTAITTASAVVFATLFVLESMGHEGGPYTGILTFMVVPAFFVLGLVLIPLGTWLQKRRERRMAERGEAAPLFPVIDLNQDRTRKLVLIFFAVTLVNVVILAVATYKGVEVMDSTGFCGQTCHSVMIPEFTTYERSPHSRVPCVDCHIGPGADWFVKSKLSGSWQVVSVAFNLYPRPIPAPVHNLRPARETCEQCHWPTKFIGDKLRVITRYAENETNAEQKTVLMIRVGGTQPSGAHGIHWHVAPGVEIRYRSDAKREVISEIESKSPDGSTKRFLSDGSAKANGQAGEPSEWRVMDCVDCHNRPTHIYRAAEDEIDRALSDGLIDRSLPFIRREGLLALKDAYPSHDAARQGIAERIRAFYAKSHPDLVASRGDAIERAGRALGDLYCVNVFPSMNITWGTYPNHIGHRTATGCFRCHDDMHKTAEGATISQDCSTCHALLAVEEENPGILAQIQP